MTPGPSVPKFRYNLTDDKIAAALKRIGAPVTPTSSEAMRAILSEAHEMDARRAEIIGSDNGWNGRPSGWSPETQGAMADLARAIRDPSETFSPEKVW